MLASVLLSFWALACGVCDLRSRKIPNVLTLGAACAALLGYAWSAEGVFGVPWAPSLLTASVVFAAAAALFATGWVGAGDVKLWTAMALLAGPPIFAVTMLVGSLLAGAWALALLRAPQLPALALPYLEAQGWNGLALADRPRIPLAAPYGVAFVGACWGWLG